MRNLVLGGLFVLTSGAAIAYVYTNPVSHPCEACPAEPKAGDAVDPAPCEGLLPSASCCSKCKPAVVDVVDLGTAYPVAPAPTGNAISFEEPPLAQPRSPIYPAQYTVPASEIAPAPRDAAELAPEPRMAK